MGEVARFDSGRPGAEKFDSRLLGPTIKFVISFQLLTSKTISSFRTRHLHFGSVIDGSEVQIHP
jgi:hypothetical protein